MVSPLLVTDLDGTFLANNGRVSAATAQIVADLLGKGLRFTFATARSPQTALPLLKSVPFQLPAVVYNGAFLADPRTGKLSDGVYLAADALEVLLAHAVGLGLTPLVFHFAGGRDRVSAVAQGQTWQASQFFADRADAPRSCSR